MSSEKDIKKKEEEPIARRADTLFDDIRQNIEREMQKIFSHPWPPAFEMRFPPVPFFTWPDVRAPLCDVLDRGDRYDLSVEVPGIEKEEIEVKATSHSIQVHGEHSEKKEEKSKDYLQHERSYKSFYRKIPFPEEIVASKIEAKVVNGILNVTIPKKVPTKADGETKVEVK